MISAVIISLVLFLGPYGSLGTDVNLGTCPSIEPVSGFQMKNMLGLWYVIQKTSTMTSCLVFNFISGNKPGVYAITETSQSPVPGTPLWHQLGTTGQLRVPDESTPARMIANFPLDVLGDEKFTIFDTDYENYAGIFTCQQVAFSNIKSISILSREKWLDQIYLNQVREKITSIGMNPFDLSIISQTKCPNSTDWNNINIDSDTFSLKGAINAAKNTGGVLSGGLNYIFSGASNALQGLTGQEKNKYASKNDESWLP